MQAYFLCCSYLYDIIICCSVTTTPSGVAEVSQVVNDEEMNRRTRKKLKNLFPQAVALVGYILANHDLPKWDLRKKFPKYPLA